MATDFIEGWDSSSNKKTLLPLASITRGVNWSELVSNFTITPVLISTISSGDVYQYEYEDSSGPNIVYYRLVPQPYTEASDAFYTSFSEGVLSNEVARRGHLLV